MLWETPFLAISASLVLKFEISASKLVDWLRPRIFSTQKSNFSICFLVTLKIIRQLAVGHTSFGPRAIAHRKTQLPFLAISASLVLKFELSVSKLVGSVRPHIFSTHKRNFSICLWICAAAADPDMPRRRNKTTARTNLGGQNNDNANTAKQQSGEQDVAYS